MRLVFFGSDNFSLKPLQRIYEKGFKNSQLTVICPADQPSRHQMRLHTSPVKAFCQRHDIPYFHPPSETTLKGWQVPLLRKNEFYDAGVVASFRYFIPSSILSQFPLGVYNIHPSLLPKYKGPTPIHYAILNGDSETGVSIIKMTNKIDSGLILDQVKTSIPDDMMFSQLFENLSSLGADRISHVLENLYDYASIEKVTITNNDPTIGKEWVTKKITREMGRLDVNFTSEKVWNHWRAFNETIHFHTFFRKKRVLLSRMIHPKLIIQKPSSSISLNCEPCNKGKILYLDDKIFIGVQDGWIAFDQVYLEGQSKSKTLKQFAKQVALIEGHLDTLDEDPPNIK